MRFLVVIFIAFSFKLVAQESFLHTFKTEGKKLKVAWFPKNEKVFQLLLTNSAKISIFEANGEVQEGPISYKFIKKTIPFTSKTDSIQKTGSDFFLMGEYLLAENANKLDSTNSNNFYDALIQLFFDKEACRLLENQITIPISSSKTIFYFKIEIEGLSTPYLMTINPRNYNPVKPALKLSNQRNRVMGEWNVKELNPHFCAYNIYRKDPNSDFRKLNELPLLDMQSTAVANPNIKTYIDKNLKKGIKYTYYLGAIDYFGDESYTSEHQQIYIGKDVDAVIAIDTVKAVNTTREIMVSINPIADSIKPNISKLLLYRSKDIKGPYVLTKEFNRVNPASRNEKFVLDGYKTGDSYYYTVIAVSDDKDSVKTIPYYFFTLDQEPPGVVTKIKAEIDSLGIVTLSWINPPDNDIQGYRVFRANTKREEFVERTTRLKTDLSFKDTVRLDNLSEKIYYFIATVDDNFNNSKNSDTILVIKPDTIAPQPPAFKDYQVSKNGVELKWVNSSSKDVITQFILKKESSVNKFDTLTIWKKDLTTFLDTNVISGVTYNYVFASIDDSKNISITEPVLVNFELGYRPEIKSLKAEVDRKNKEVDLTWSYDKIENVYSFEIYRTKEGGKYTLYETIVVEPGTKLEFSDKFVTINSKFKYKIKAVLKSGLSTKMSKEVIVEY